MIEWARKRSPWILHFNAGSCNGCDIELAATYAPHYDVERFGILRKGRPRHADVMVVTGVVNRQAKDRLVRIYEQIPSPKRVVALGTCATSGAPFIDSYNVYGGVDMIIPVDVYVLGCPPKPEAVIQGLIKTTTKKDEGTPVMKAIAPVTNGMRGDSEYPLDGKGRCSLMRSTTSNRLRRGWSKRG